MIVSLFHYLWSLKKREAHIETVVIPDLDVNALK